MVFTHVPMFSTAWFTSTEHNVKNSNNGTSQLEYSCLEMDLGYNGFSNATRNCTFLMFNPDFQCKTGTHFVYKVTNALP